MNAVRSFLFALPLLVGAPLVSWAQDGDVASIELTMTLAEDTDPMTDECGATDTLTVGEGVAVEVCYTVTNTGSVTLNFHDLVDTELGPILTNFNFTLDPASSAFLTMKLDASATTTFNGTWTAYNEGPVDVASSMDSATLTVVPPSIDLEMTLAADTDPMLDECGTQDTLTVDQGDPVEVCYTITNTGMTPLGMHDLVDTVLGPILTDFPFNLAPGSSAFLTMKLNASATTTFEGTWTAFNEDPPVEASDTDSATLEVIAATTATFAVEKFFDDGNPAEVEVTISCNTGLPLEQSTMISEGDGVVFVVGDFNDGEMNCTVTETAGSDGYAVEYFDGAATSPDGCTFDGVLLAGEYSCEITNTLLPVDIEVTKSWVDDNPQFQSPYVAEATWACANVQSGAAEGELFFVGNPDTQSFSVFPHWDGTTTCTVIESLLEGDVEFDDSDCDGLSVVPGSGASCEIVNTRLYAGIPTLDRYGLLLLAVLMLGLGLVAARRFA